MANLALEKVDQGLQGEAGPAVVALAAKFEETIDGGKLVDRALLHPESHCRNTIGEGARSKHLLHELVVAIGVGVSRRLVGFCCLREGYISAGLERVHFCGSWTPFGILTEHRWRSMLAQSRFKVPPALALVQHSRNFAHRLALAAGLHWLSTLATSASFASLATLAALASLSC